MLLLYICIDQEQSLRTITQIGNEAWALLFTISTFADETGTAKCTYADLSAELGVSISTVHRYLSQLLSSTVDLKPVIVAMDKQSHYQIVSSAFVWGDMKT